MDQDRSVVRREHVSAHGFEETIAAFDAAVGSRNDADYAADAEASRTSEDYETRMRAAQESSGFMRFSKLDHGHWLTLLGMSARAFLYTIGNPLIARTMLRHGLGAALYVPVRVLVYEDAIGATRISYDLPSTLMSGLGAPELIEAARRLDAKMDSLAAAVAGRGGDDPG